MSSAKNSNDTIVTSNNKRVSAMKKYVTNAKTEIPVAGQVLKPADVIAVFQDDLAKRAVVVTTKAAYGAAVVARTESSQTRQVTDDALKGWVLNRFGDTSAEAKEFGYAPRKKPAMSAQERAAAVEANQATRKARGTMPRSEKEKITGATVASTAPAAPAVTAPAAAPAAGVSASTNGAPNGAPPTNGVAGPH